MSLTIKYVFIHFILMFELKFGYLVQLSYSNMDKHIFVFFILLVFIGYRLLLIVENCICIYKLWLNISELIQLQRAHWHWFALATVESSSCRPVISCYHLSLVIITPGAQRSPPALLSNQVKLPRWLFIITSGD